MQNKYIHREETNSSAITTSATGGGTFTSGLKVVKEAIIQYAGYVVVVTGATGNAVSFQLYQQSAATGALTEPAAAVDIAAGAMTASVWGY